MKISKIKIKNFRCHKDLELDFDDLTILVGPNGAGKSAVICALDWFFTGENISEADIHGKTQQNKDHAEEDLQIEVSVEFVDLSSSDREILGKYGKKETANFTRMRTPDGEIKLYGNSLHGPGFAKVRNADNATIAQEEYKHIAEQITDLPNWKSHKAAKAALDEWEAKSENRGHLVEVQDEDTSHLYGIAGKYVLEKCFRMIFVPAAMNISDEVGESSKGSILNRLVGEVAKMAVAEARGRWLEENKAQMDALDTSIRNMVREATTEHEKVINRHLSRLIRDASVVLRGESPDWNMRGEASIQTDILVNGQQIRLDRQGHGVQRAAVIAILQALVDRQALSVVAAEGSVGGLG